MSNKPNLFIVGTSKSGTTSLHYYLSKHQDIYMSELKEPHYFAKIPVLGPTTSILDDDKYLNLFENSNNEKFIGEASATYLYFEGTAERIKKFNPNSKIIIILRNPMERAFSHYLMDRDRYGTEDNASEVVLMDEDYTGKYGFHGLDVNPYIFPSLYTKHIKKYLEVFGTENVKIIFFEDMIQDQENTLLDLLKWLGLTTNKFKFDKENKNPYRKVRYPKIYSLLEVRLIRKLKSLISPKLKKHILNFLYQPADKPKLSTELKNTMYDNFFKQDINELAELLKINLNEKWKLNENK